MKSSSVSWTRSRTLVLSVEVVVAVRDFCRLKMATIVWLIPLAAAALLQSLRPSLHQSLFQSLLHSLRPFLHQSLLKSLLQSIPQSPPQSLRQCLHQSLLRHAVVTFPLVHPTRIAALVRAAACAVFAITFMAS
jgi:hypothetical protein